ncbi:polysaccharide pyruvyl transferase family protein [Oenococcus oeni]|uniref:polysaccharide pyruvyl transferase family protein n=1 Tax=Oenococcus oeni TaxID=1247 RepID=UPI00178C2C63|nr:polysaccharide pyruvyl transferase family protein [Oenococcus oeni]
MKVELFFITMSTSLYTKIKKKLFLLFHGISKYFVIINDLDSVIFLFGVPIYGNLGDQAIAEGERELLSRCTNKKILEVIEPETQYFIRKIKKIENKTGTKPVLFWQGGGNMGDVWVDQEKLRQLTALAFPNDKIFFLPQSVSFKKNSDIFRKSHFVYDKLTNSFFFFRDKISWSFARDKMGISKNNFLVPDTVIALTRSINYFHSTREGILKVFRSDIEKENVFDSQKESLSKYLSKIEYIQVFDTVHHELEFFGKAKRKRIIKKTLNLFSLKKLIITDRLHGLIFSVITNTPVIVFDNNNHKISNFVHTWLDDFSFVYLVKTEDSTEKIRQVAHNFLYHYDRNSYIKNNDALYRNIEEYENVIKENLNNFDKLD